MTKTLISASGAAVATCGVFILMLFAVTNVQAAGVGGLFKSLVGQTNADSLNIDETLVKMSQKMNRSMPQTVDGDTRLEKVSAQPSQQLSYHYTLINIRSNEIDTASFYRAMRPVLQKRVCAADDLKMFFRNQITVAYAYQGKDGEDVGKLAFSPKDCGYPNRRGL